MRHTLDLVPHKTIEVLDKGYVQLIDVMPGVLQPGELPELAIVDAARVSYQKGTIRKSTDQDLIRYLFNNRHTSPFEQVIFKFEIKAPLFVVQQILRHRTARLNQESARYSVMAAEYYVPDAFRAQGQSNKQGSEQKIDPWIEGLEVSALGLYCDRMEEAFEAYRSLIDNGVAREMARFVLPHATYTKMVWQMDLSNLLKFIRLRSDSHAQWETRQYSDALGTFVEALCPTVWEVFNDG